MFVAKWVKIFIYIKFAWFQGLGRSETSISRFMGIAEVCIIPNSLDLRTNLDISHISDFASTMTRTIGIGIMDYRSQKRIHEDGEG